MPDSRKRSKRSKKTSQAPTDPASLLPAAESLADLRSAAISAVEWRVHLTPDREIVILLDGKEIRRDAA